MERDFMGLNSKDYVVVKEETVEGGGKEETGVLWPLSSKVPTVPNSISLKSEQDQQPSKMMSDLPASQGYMLMSGSDIFEAICKQQSAHIENFGGATVAPLATSHSVLPSAAIFSGTTGQWINSKASGFPAQLTIFYGGTVSVFDAISPEKAQAIFILAGNGCIPSNMAQLKPHIQPLDSKFPQADLMMVNQNRPPCSGLPSPMSVSSHPIDQSAGEDVKVSKTVGMSTTLISKLEMPRVIPSIGSIAASAMMSSALPQARRASLARFLEKRKERVMNATPYNLSKKADGCTNPESNGVCFSATSGAGSTSGCQH